MNKFEKYYRNNLVSLPPRPQFRQFKFILVNGKCIKINDTIRDSITMRRKLILFNPVNVYYSVGEFYQPRQVGCKPKNNRTPGGLVSKNMFLRGDYSLEIDSKDEKNVRLAKEILNRFGLENLYFVNSHRGIHIHAYDFWEKFCPNILNMPGDRERYYYMKKVYLTKKLTLKGVDLDFPTTIDTRRVIGLPFSLHKRGTVRFGNTDLEKVLEKWN